jgi:diguanylate cyclase (GGDEF)-like protein/PAS domain S-box-containing protein
MTDFALNTQLSQPPDSASIDPTVALALVQHFSADIGQAADFETALNQLLSLVCTYTQWTFGEVWLPQAGRLMHSGIWHASQPALEGFGEVSQTHTFLPHEGLPGRVWSTGQTEWLADVSHCSIEQFQRRNLALQYQLGAGLGVPITFDDQVLMVLTFFMTKVQAHDRDQVRLVEAIASQLGAILRLKQTEAELMAHQDHLQRLVHTLPGIVFTAEGPPDWRMRSLSAGCSRLTGYDTVDLTNIQQGISYNDITHPEDLPRVLTRIREALAEGHVYEVEYRIHTRCGQEKWVWEKGQGVFDSAGNVVGLQGFITEITQLKHTEAALRTNETLYRALAERSQDLISKHDASGYFCYVSPACRNLLGYEPDELIGRSPRQLFHPAETLRIIRHYRQFIRHQSVHATLRFRMRHRDGTYRWFETISCLIEEPTTAGDRQVLAVSRDVTERVKYEQALITREQFLSLVLNNIPQHLFWKDCNGIYLGCNQTFAEAVGISSTADIVNKTDYDIPVYSTEMARQFRQQDQAIIQANWPELNRLESYTEYSRDGTARWLNCSKLPIYDAEQQVIGILGMLEDVSDRVIYQQTLTLREQYLTALVELQRQLLDFDSTWNNERFCQALHPLGKATSAHRVYIYEVAENAPDTLSLRAQWVADTKFLTADHPEMQAFSLHGPLAPWFEHLRQGHPINQTLEQFPPAIQACLGTPPANVKSILLLPLNIQGRFSGAVGFSNCTTERLWSQSEVNLLRVAANALAIAIERFQTEVSLRRAETKYRSIFENAVEGIFQTTPTGKYITVNPMLAQIYGYDSPQDLIASLTDIERQLYVEPNARRYFIERMLDQGSVIGFESAIRKKDGSIIWISESARTIHDANGNLIGFEGTVEDITRRKQTELELQRRDQLLQGVAQASKYLLTNVDLETTIPKVLSILGHASAADRVYLYENHPHPVTGVAAMSMRYEWTQPDIAPSIDQPHWQNQSYEHHGLMRWYRVFQAGQTIRGPVDTFPLDEQILLAQDNIRSILMVPIFIAHDFWGHIGFDACHEARHWTSNDESILITIAASLGGALQRRETEERMRYQAFHDPLTGLPNRTDFNQHLPQAIRAARHANATMAVMFLDLDRFKNINDTLGHAVGDKLLKAVTQRMTHELRKDDLLSRWGGDEFTLILQNLASCTEAKAIAERLAACLRPPFVIDHQELYITSSIGIAMYPEDGEDVTTLLQNADAAMYAAKADGRNTHRFYNSTLKSTASRQLLLEKHLHQALQREEFQLFYQPQIDIKRGKVCHVEALIRWQSPDLGNVPPNEFIPIAEEIGLIVPLGDWVLKQACYQLQTWHQQGFAELEVAVNLSAVQLQQAELVQNLKQLLQVFDLDPHHLEIEITETAALTDVDASIIALNQLRNLGTRIVMDDFGTGYSSLSYLKRLPFHGLKIDRSFVKDIPTDAQDIAMLKAIIALGQELQLSIVAEGVETLEQVECLQKLGCHNMQGYWFSCPMDAAMMTTFLEHHQSTYNAYSNES